jgi:hypothetical protein
MSSNGQLQAGLLRADSKSYINGPTAANPAMLARA